MKKLICLVLCLAICWTLATCGPTQTSSEPQTTGVLLTDALGNTAKLSEDPRIAVCYGSFAQCLQLAGIEPVAVTDDAVTEHSLTFPEGTGIIGTVKEINTEILIAANPDYVILSADLSAHMKLEGSLKQAGLRYGYFRVDTFDDYKAFMGQLCSVSGRDDLYHKNVVETEERINKIKEKIPKDIDSSALLMRVFSTGIKAKSDDNLAGLILKEFGLINIADLHPSLLEELSLEQIISDDPDFIFASTMGNEENALGYLEQNITSNPAWKELSAIKNNRFVVLPKALFHYKPNQEWDKAYEFIAKIVFPEVFGE